MENYNGIIGSSEFYSLPKEKYYDKYTSTTSNVACNGIICYGHALSETEKWNSEHRFFVDSITPWFTRGGSMNGSSAAGVFSSTGRASTSGYAGYSFHVVLL